MMFGVTTTFLDLAVEQAFRGRSLILMGFGLRISLQKPANNFGWERC